jgi:succinyl-CoA synthetase beta subunit
VHAILVNIFGGIMRCDTIATGIINAAKSIKLDVPLIVRLQGTNVKEANELLARSDVKCIRAADLDDAAFKAVRAANIVSLAKELNVNVTMSS